MNKELVLAIGHVVNAKNADQILFVSDLPKKCLGHCFERDEREIIFFGCSLCSAAMNDGAAESGIRRGEKVLKCCWTGYSSVRYEASIGVRRLAN